MINHNPIPPHVQMVDHRKPPFDDRDGRLAQTQPGFLPGFMTGVLMTTLILGIMYQWKQDRENEAQTQSLIGQIEGGPRR